MKKRDLEKNAYQDQTALIVCNGPSLVDVPTEFLGKYISFASNSIYLAKPDFTPDFYCLEGWSHLSEKHPNGGMRISEELISHRLPLVDRVGQSGGVTFVNRRALAGFAGSPNVWGIDYRDEHGNILRGWSDDPLVRHATGRSVTFFMLQAAHWLGFDPVLIVGLDHRYHGEVWHAYDDDTDPVSGHVMSKGRYESWAPSAERSYEIAADRFAVAERTILNLTPNTASRAFETDDLESWE